MSVVPRLQGTVAVQDESVDGADQVMELLKVVFEPKIVFVEGVVQETFSPETDFSHICLKIKNMKLWV